MFGGNHFGSFCGKQNVHPHYVRGPVDRVGVTCTYGTRREFRGQVPPMATCLTVTPHVVVILVGNHFDTPVA